MPHKDSKTGDCGKFGLVSNLDKDCAGRSGRFGVLVNGVAYMNSSAQVGIDSKGVNGDITAKELRFTTAGVI